MQTPDIRALIRSIERLADGDFVPVEAGDTLLAQMSDLLQACETDRPETVEACVRRLCDTLEGLVRHQWLDAGDSREALRAVRQLIERSGSLETERT